MSRRVLMPAPPDVIMLLWTMAGQAVAPFVPLIAQNLGLSPGTIGVLVGLGGITALVASLLAGTLVSSVGPRRLVLLGSVVAASGFGLIWWAPSVAALVVVLPTIAAMGAIMSISVQTLVFMGLDPSRPDHIVGMHAFYASMGLVLGPLLGSAVVRAAGALEVVFMLGAAAITAAALVARAAPERGTVETARPQPFLTDALSISASARLALSTVLIAEFCYVAWATFFPLALRSAGRTPEFIGLVFAANGVVVSLVRPALAFLVSRLSRPGVLAGSLFVTSAGLLAAAVPHSTVLIIVCAVCLGVGIGLIFPITMLMVSEGITGRRIGRLLSLRFVAMMLGQIFGPVLGGLAAALSVVGALGGIGAVSAATGLFVVSRARRRAFLDTRKSAMLP